MTTRRLVLVAVVLLVTTALVAPPRRARAQQSAGIPLTDVFVLTLLTPPIVVGIVTDIMVGVDLNREGYVPLGWSITGTAVWSIVSVTELEVAYGNAAQARASLGDPATYLLTAACLGSLAWSIYGIARHTPPVTVAPAAFATPGHALVPGLAVTARW